MIDGPLDCPERIDASHANMKRLGVYWIIQQGAEPPIHIDNWREREKLRLEYERQRTSLNEASRQMDQKMKDAFIAQPPKIGL